MEVSIQELFGIFIAIVIMFVLPVYMAFEKKDDVSYILAVKLTSEFVSNVKNNGYISIEMYEDYINNLSVTGNQYDVNIKHIAYKCYPIIYSKNGSGEIVGEFDYTIYKDNIASGMPIIHNGVHYDNLEVSYYETQEIYGKEEILNSLDESNIIIKGISQEDYRDLDLDDFGVKPDLYSELAQPGNKNAIGKIYTLNKGDEFIIELINTNTTIAENMFNTFTAGITGFSIPRVYMLYGTIVENMMYIG